MPQMRLDKFFSSQELLSRKEIKPYIKKGLIKVNGSPAKSPDQRIDAGSDVITLNGETIEYKPYIYIMLNKPQGVVSATDDKINRTVLDLVPDELMRTGLFPAGRLDKDTEGFVLLTNDGNFAHEILSPKHHIEKAYIVKLDGNLSDSDKKKIENGITLADGTLCQKAKINLLENGEKSTVEIIICEGKYHQIKRMFGVVGLGVDYLKRTRMGGVILDPNLPLGECREMLHKEVQEILANTHKDNVDNIL